MGTKIIAFMNSYLPGGRSGGDVRFVEIMKRIREVPIYVVTPKVGRSFCEEMGLRAYYLITTHECSSRYFILVYLYRILNLFSINISIEPNDILYVSSDFLTDVLPAFWLKVHNSKVIWVQLIFHLISPPFKREGFILYNILSFFTQKISFFIIKKYADKIIVINSLMKHELVKRGFREDNIYINHIGIDIKERKIDQKQYDGVYLGRLHPSKGVFDLIKIWGNVCRFKENATIAVIGYGEPKVVRKLYQMINSEGLDGKVFIFGYLGDEEVMNIFSKSKVFVFPSKEEGYGIAIMEALAFGLPVIAYNLKIYEELFLDGIVKVPVADYDCFASKIINLLESPALYQEYVDKSRKIISRYKWEDIVKRELEILQI